MLSFWTLGTTITSLIVLSPVVAVRQFPVCDAGLYGHPSAAQCRHMISALDTLTDKKTHFFALASVAKRPQGPPWMLDVSTYEWRNRVHIPMIKHGQGAASCNVGIFPIELPDGSMSWDTTKYNSLSEDGKRVVETCSESTHITPPGGFPRAAGPGGRILAGRRDRLALILYESGSQWDYQVQAAEAHNQPIYVPRSALPAVAPIPPPVAAPILPPVAAPIPPPVPAPVLPPLAAPAPHPGPAAAWGADYGAEGQGSSWE